MKRITERERKEKKQKELKKGKKGKRGKGRKGERGRKEGSEGGREEIHHNLPNKVVRSPGGLVYEQMDRSLKKN